jgi:mono/diheme cytochrome c family protein
MIFEVKRLVFMKKGEYNFFNLRWRRRIKMKKLLWVVMLGSFFLFSSLGQTLGESKAPPKKTPELLTQGKKLYEQNCVTCHGPKGDGKGQLGAALKPPPSDFTKPFNQWANGKGDLKKVFDVITKGIPNTSMVKWDQFSEQERWALVYTVVGFAVPPKKK